MGPCGDCYRYAANFVINNGGTLIHGSILHPLIEAYMPHAWAIKDGLVYDWQMKEGVWEKLGIVQGRGPISVEQYDEIFAPMVLKEWDDVMTILNTSLQARHWGPWVTDYDMIPNDELDDGVEENPNKQCPVSCGLCCDQECEYLSERGCVIPREERHRGCNIFFCQYADAVEDGTMSIKEARRRARRDWLKADDPEENPRFEIIEEASPLEYNTDYPVRRISITEPNAPEPRETETYFASQEDLPGASKDVVAFIDYFLVGSDYLYINYMKTRSDYTRQGLMRKLIDYLYDKYSSIDYFDWGKIMSEHVWKLYLERRHDKQGPYTRGKHYF